MVFRSLLVLFAGLVASTTAAPAIIGKELPFAYAVNATARVPWQQTISVAGAKFLTVHFSRFQLAEGDVVTISDATTGALAVSYSGLGRGDLGDKGGFYSPQVFASSVTVQYKPSAATAPAGDLGFAIDKVVRSASSGSVSSVCGDSQFEVPKCLIGDPRVPLAYSKAQAVVRLTFGPKSCTGWLVGNEGHLITNQHCIASQEEASSTDFEFDAESPTCDDQCLVVGGCRGRFATSAQFLASNAELDYALVKLTAGFDLSKYGSLKLRVSGPVDQEQIYIPQHPRGRAKEIVVTVDGGAVARATVGVKDACGPYRVSYVADTEGGSSGSPILAASDNAVVALHSCGAPEIGECKNSALDVRTLIYDLKKKNVLPDGALDDASRELVDGPWLPQVPTPAPGPVTPAPTLDVCPSWTSQWTCEVFMEGKCKWTADKKCVKNAAASAAPAPLL